MLQFSEPRIQVGGGDFSLAQVLGDGNQRLVCVGKDRDQTLDLLALPIPLAQQLLVLGLQLGDLRLLLPNRLGADLLDQFRVLADRADLLDEEVFNVLCRE